MMLEAPMLAAMLLVPLQAAHAEPGPVRTPAAEAALEVLETHCGNCHQRELLDGRPPGGGLSNLLELEALGRDPSLVIPGFPDGSGLYTRMLSGHGPGDVFGLAQGGRGPSREEIEKVRDWIGGLEAASCPAEPAVSRDSLAADIKNWLEESGPEARAATRFVSLASLVNRCESESALGAARAAAEAAIRRIAQSPQAAGIETVGDRSALLALRLDELGIAAERWDRVATSCGREPAEAVAAPCLAAAVLEQPGGPQTAAAMTVIADARAGIVLPPEHGLAELARRHRRDLDLASAAAEAMLPQAGLIEKLEASAADETLVRRLRQGRIGRKDWQRLSVEAGLSGPADGPALGAGGEKTFIDIALNSDKPGYKTGDLAVFEAVADTDCNLTLIEVDPKGEATVLFPNDFEQTNAIQAGRAVRIPPDTAGYQLRLDNAGEETVIAICQRPANRPEGIGHDFEHRRFTRLGNWRDQLRLTAEREAEWKKRMEELARFKPRVRRKGPDAEALPAPQGPEMEGRAAIRFKVE